MKSVTVISPTQNTILILLLISVLIASVASAQVEIESLFSINRTLWKNLTNQFPDNIGFSEGLVYIYNTDIQASILCSESSINDSFLIAFFNADCDFESYTGILSPLLGLGIANWCMGEDCIESRLMIKISNNWYLQ